MSQAEINRKSLQTATTAIESAIKTYERDTGNRVTEVIMTTVRAGSAPPKVKLKIETD